MTKITLQMIWDAAFKEFILLNNPPAAEQIFEGGNYHCRYTTRDGRHCAVGLVLPEEYPLSEMMDTLVDKIPDWFDESVLTQSDLSCFQTQLHDVMVNDKTGKWTYSRKERWVLYMITANEFKCKLPDVNDFQLYPHAKAQQIVDQLAFGELDGWEYKTEKMSDTHSRVIILDDSRMFVAYWKD